MDSTIVKSSHAHTVERSTRLIYRRKLARRIGFCLLIASVVADHLRTTNRRRDDWDVYDARRFAFVSATAADTILLGDFSGSPFPVKLLGYLPPRYGSPKNIPGALNSILKGEDVTLHLEPTQTRDDSDQLMAEAFQNDSRPVAASLVQEGFAVADRRNTFAFSHVVSAAQSEARRKHAGIWKR